jgi:hypothetical protein
MLREFKRPEVTGFSAGREYEAVFAGRNGGFWADGVGAGGSRHTDRLSEMIVPNQQTSPRGADDASAPRERRGMPRTFKKNRAIGPVACCAFSFLIALIAQVTSAGAATVSWEFFEESLIFLSDGSPVPNFVPGRAASLSISDSDFLKGGISYSAINLNFDNIPAMFKITGDTDFSFSASSDAIGGVVLPISPTVVYQDAEIDTINTPAGIFSGSVSLDSIVNNFRMTVVNDLATGTIATDDDALQCPFSQCGFTGFWTLTSSLPVAEPGSIVLLTTAVSVLGFLRHRARGRRSRRNTCPRLDGHH